MVRNIDITIHNFGNNVIDTHCSFKDAPEIHKHEYGSEVIEFMEVPLDCGIAIDGPNGKRYGTIDTRSGAVRRFNQELEGHGKKPKPEHVFLKIEKNNFLDGITDKMPKVNYFIDVNEISRGGGGGAYNAAMEEARFIDDTEFPIGINLITLYSSEDIKKITREYEFVTYSPVCTCGYGTVPENLSVRVGEIGKNVKNIIFRSKMKAYKGHMGEKCGIRSVINPSDIIQINSVKDQYYLQLLEDKLDRLKEERVPHGTGARTALACTSSMIDSLGRDKMLELSKKSDIYVSNLDEFRHLLGDSDLFTDSEGNNRKMYDAMNFIRGKGGKVYVTCGNQGVLLMDDFGNLYLQPASDVTGMQTTGCGDVFCGTMVTLEATEWFTPLQILDMANAGGQMHYSGVDVTHGGLKNFRINEYEKNGHRMPFYRFKKGPYSFDFNQPLPRTVNWGNQITVK